MRNTPRLLATVKPSSTRTLSRLPPQGAAKSSRHPSTSSTAASQQKTPRPGPRRAEKYAPRQISKWPKVSVRGQFVIAAVLSVVIGYNYLWQPAYSDLVGEKKQNKEADRSNATKAATIEHAANSAGGQSAKAPP